MATDGNSVFLRGNVGADIEEATTPTGKKKINFPLATKRFSDSPSEWHRVVAWEQAAEAVLKIGIKKGSRICIDGARLHYNVWEGDDGRKRKDTEIVIDYAGIISLETSTGEGAPKKQARDFRPPKLEEEPTPPKEDLPF